MLALCYLYEEIGFIYQLSTAQTVDKLSKSQSDISISILNLIAINIPPQSSYRLPCCNFNGYVSLADAHTHRTYTNTGSSYVRWPLYWSITGNNAYRHNTIEI